MLPSLLFGFVRSVMGHGVHDCQVFFEQLIGIPIRDHQIPNESISGTQPKQGFVAREFEKTLVKSILQLASFSPRTVSARRVDFMSGQLEPIDICPTRGSTAEPCC